MIRFSAAILKLVDFIANVQIQILVLDEFREIPDFEFINSLPIIQIANEF